MIICTKKWWSHSHKQFSIQIESKSSYVAYSTSCLIGFVYFTFSFISALTFSGTVVKLYFFIFFFVSVVVVFWIDLNSVCAHLQRIAMLDNIPIGTCLCQPRTFKSCAHWHKWHLVDSPCACHFFCSIVFVMCVFKF